VVVVGFISGAMGFEVRLWVKEAKWVLGVKELLFQRGRLRSP
jgi:hypothetical protein